MDFIAWTILYNIDATYTMLADQHSCVLRRVGEILAVFCVVLIGNVNSDCKNPTDDLPLSALQLFIITYTEHSKTAALVNPLLSFTDRNLDG